MARLLAVLGAGVLAIFGCAHADGAAAEQKPVVQQPANEARTLSAAEAQALAGFNERVTEYARMHQRLEATLPKLPKETSAEIIDGHQRALEKLIRADRRNAKRGDLLAQDVRAVFRKLFARVFVGKEGLDLRATILDENPGQIRLIVNSRYPDSIPLPTVPPQVLASLPKLPEELEYRFIGDRLVLLDVHAQIVVDFMENALPR